MDNIFEIENLFFSYQNFTLDINSVKIEKNEKIAILGENGCGKTTLLNVLSGYNENFKGRISLFNENIKKIPFEAKAKKLSYLSQFANISFGYTVYETILFGRFPYLRGEKFTKQDYEKTDKLIKDFNLEKLRERQFSTLSGGEKRKVMVAKTLNQETDVILLDEPTNMVDIKFSMFILKKLSMLNATVVSTIHDINMALQFFGRFLLMKNGKIIFDLNKKEITREILNETYEVHFNQIGDFFVPEH